MTNAEHIRSMTDEELAELMVDFNTACRYCEKGKFHCNMGRDCSSGYLQWLKRKYWENEGEHDTLD
jgi:hypothetical protein